MTLLELRKQIRDLVPDEVSTNVELSIWDFYSDSSHEHSVETRVRISSHWRTGMIDAVEDKSATVALAKFVERSLPKIRRALMPRTLRQDDDNAENELAAAEADCVANGLPAEREPDFDSECG